MSASETLNLLETWWRLPALQPPDERGRIRGRLDALRRTLRADKHR